MIRPTIRWAVGVIRPGTVTSIATYQLHDLTAPCHTSNLARDVAVLATLSAPRPLGEG